MTSAGKDSTLKPTGGHASTEHSSDGGTRSSSSLASSTSPELVFDVHAPAVVEETNAEGYSSADDGGCVQQQGSCLTEEDVKTELTKLLFSTPPPTNDAILSFVQVS